MSQEIPERPSGIFETVKAKIGESALGKTITRGPRLRNTLAPLKDLGRVQKALPKHRRVIGEFGATEAGELDFADGKLRSAGSRSEHQNIRLLLLNAAHLSGDTEGDEKPITVCFSGITDSVTDGLAGLAAREIAKVIGGPVVVFDVPPYGGSGDLTAKQMSQLMSERGMGEMAKSHLRALKQLLIDKWYFKNVKAASLMSDSLIHNVLPRYLQQVVDKQTGAEVMVINGTGSTISSQGGSNASFVSKFVSVGERS